MWQVANRTEACAMQVLTLAAAVLKLWPKIGANQKKPPQELQPADPKLDIVHDWSLYRAPSGKPWLRCRVCWALAACGLEE